VIETYGEDSDFVRVRVRGLPPAADELQFIDRERIQEAQAREPQSLPDDPLICGVDVSGGGAAWNVCAFRRGGDAHSILRIRIPNRIKVLPEGCPLIPTLPLLPPFSSSWP
jgi:hypothetical protein